MHVIDLFHFPPTQAIMDNRRVLRSFRERQEAARLPYARKEGLFAKVKLFLAPSTLWNSPKNASLTDSSSKPIASSPVLELAPGTANVTSQGTGLRSVLETPQRPTLASLNRPESTPQQVLSSFFETKGNEPLTDVEYAGVVSLLEKSRQTTPKWLSVRASELLELHSVAETPKGLNNGTSNHKGGSRVHGASETSETVDNAAELSSLTIFTTPYPQRVLKGDGTSFATPEYRPVYHTVAGGVGRLSVPSVKRVYQFSGLPSPYRTRIRTPTISSRRTRPRDAENSLFVHHNSTLGAGTEHGTSKNGSKHHNGDGRLGGDSRPLSTAANKLLSILDDAQGSETEKNQLGQFLSPFEKPTKKRTALEESAPQKKQLTALDISRTMKFDQLEELPKQKEEVQNNKNKVNDSEKRVNSDQNGSRRKEGEDSENKSNSVVAKSAVEMKPFELAVLTTFPSSESATESDAPTKEPFVSEKPKSTGKSKGLFSFGANVSSNTPPTASKVLEPHSSDFLFGFTAKPSSESNPTDGKDLFAAKAPNKKPASVQAVPESLFGASRLVQSAPSATGATDSPFSASNLSSAPESATSMIKSPKNPPVKFADSSAPSEPITSSVLSLHITFPPIVPQLVTLDTEKVQRYKQFFQF